MKTLIVNAFVAGANWFEMKSLWAGEVACHMAAGDYAEEAYGPFTETASRIDFESMAAVAYPGALKGGRHPVHGTYINNNLEKRWKGWKACDEFRAGIVPTQQRGKS